MSITNIMRAFTMENNSALEIFNLLKIKKNVVLSGAPGTGKSRLLNEVASLFMEENGTELTTTPKHNPSSPIPIPKAVPTSTVNRKVFRTVFHQNTKHREFVSGIVPNIGNDSGFHVMAGTLYKASEFAKEHDASLLIIDEINRGPAVQIFGGSIVAIEMDKRLDDQQSPTRKTQFFEMQCPKSGGIIEYALPSNLYILAAMNQADTSVEPMDVAFLRRWFPYKLKADHNILQNEFGISDLNNLPDSPSTKEDVLKIAISAWKEINHRIALGRGEEFQLGHGIFLTQDYNQLQGVDDSLIYVCELWSLILAHVEEVFFGDIRGIAAVLNASESDKTAPIQLVESYFADEPRVTIKFPNSIDKSNIYNLYRSILAK